MPSCYARARAGRSPLACTLSAMQSALQSDERILYETRANYGRGLTAPSGRLTLTNRRLVFEPSHIESTQQIIQIPVGEVTSAERVWLPGAFGRNIVRALRVGRTNGDQLTFLVNRPMRWRKAIAPYIQV